MTHVPTHRGPADDGRPSRSSPHANDPHARLLATNGAIRESCVRASRTNVRNRQWINIDRRAFFARLAVNGVAIVPTLVVLEHLGMPDDDALKRQVAEADSPTNGKRILSSYLRADWREQLAEQGPDRRPVYRRLQESVRRDLREMREAGVRVLAGTDIGVLNVVPGLSLHEELTLLVRDAILSPLDALRAATRAAAVFLDRDQEIGTIAAGMRADLVLLDADPLTDIAHVSRISAVVLRGRLFDRRALTRLVDEVSDAPDVVANDWPRMPAR